MEKTARKRLTDAKDWHTKGWQMQKIDEQHMEDKSGGYRDYHYRRGDY